MAEAFQYSKKPASVGASAAVFILTVLTAPAFPTADGNLAPLLPMVFSGGGAAWLFYRLGCLPGIAASLCGWLLGWFLTGSPVRAAAALLLIPCGIAYSHVSKRRIPRSRAVGILTAVHSSLSLLLLLLTVVLQEGSFTLNGVKTVYAPFFNALKAALTESFTVTVAGQTVPFINAANAEQYVNLIIGLMPGLIVMLFTILSFLLGWSYKALLHITRSEQPEPSDWKLLPAPLTAAFFCTALLVSAVSGSGSLICLASQNIVLMLTPGFFFAGLSSLTETTIKDGVPRPRILRFLVLFFSLLLGLPALLAAASVFGVADSIRPIIPKRKGDNEP